jgi:hypothetical protein
MATILELAREVRHHLVTKDTGCLKVDYDDHVVSIDFCDGSVATDRKTFLACFRQDPVDFQFTTTDVKRPEDGGAGVSLLIEAIEAIDEATLNGLWSRYSEWKIGLQFDPDLHNTLVKKHLNTHTERLRRLMRLAVSGSLTLEPPRTSIADDIKRVNEMGAVGDWHKVLGVGKGADEAEIKQAFRKLAARFHPDRWATTSDLELRKKAEEAFKHASHAYNELMKPQETTPDLPSKPMEKKKRSRLVDLSLKLWGIRGRTP